HMSSTSSFNENFIDDINAFLASSKVAPIVHEDWGYMPDNKKKAIRQLMGNNEDLFQIFVYNKSRSIDRICPRCRKHYSAVNTIDNIEADQTGLYTNGQLEQALSGICSFECFQALNGSNALNDWFGKIADQKRNIDNVVFGENPTPSPPLQQQIPQAPPQQQIPQAPLLGKETK
ncbi:unnamed protein product, partial [Adineta steineri]